MSASPASAQSTAPAQPELSLVAPAYRESAHLATFVSEVERQLAPCGVDFELIVVDDGSPDDTFEVLTRLAARRPWLRGLRLSRNFGKEAALHAGLAEARGRAVVTLDADLQHPLALVPAMLEAWRRGAEVVHAVKTERAAHGRAYSLAANAFTALLSRLSGVALRDASDYKLLDRGVVDILVRDLPERERFFRGLAQWVGFRQVEIPFDVAPGTRDERRWTLQGLVKLAVSALVSFTNLPMQLVTLFGFITLLLSIGLGGEALVSWVRGEAVAGFLTIISVLLILGSFIMISLGIIGVYIAKIYEEVKRRPMFIVHRRLPGGDEVAGGRDGD